MATYFIFAVIALMILFISADEKNRMLSRQKEAEVAHYIHVSKLLDSFEEERKAWRKERTELIDRIQYPNVEYQTFKALNKEKTPSPTEEKKPKPELV